MIFKGFRKNSAQKHINNSLNRSRANAVSNRIKTVGIVYNLDELKNIDLLKSLTGTLNVKETDVKIVGYSKKAPESAPSFGDAFGSKDFNWMGKIKHPDLKQFVETPFDILISYYAEDVTELKMITVDSASNFKVGILQTDDRLNDLIVKTSANDFNTFKKELKKYLLILNKIADE